MSLRYAYNTNGCANHRLPDAIRLIEDAGYDGIALTLDFQHLDPFTDGWEQAAERLGADLSRRGMGLVIETGARFLLDPSDKHEPTLVTASAEGRARRVEFLSRAIRVCDLAGGEAMSFWAGVPKPGVDHGAALGWLDDGVARVTDVARAAGVDVGLEPEPGMLIETVADYDALAARLGTDAPRLALDTGHCLVTGEGDPAVFLRDRAGTLATVSIEDMQRGTHLHLPFGTGDMDMPGVLSALRETGFSRLACVELSRESPRAHAAIPEAIEWLRAAEAQLQTEPA